MLILIKKVKTSISQASQQHKESSNIYNREEYIYMPLLLFILYIYQNIRKINEKSKGEVISSEGTFIDVIERKMAERSLKDSETFFKSILNTTPCHIYIYDLEKNQNIYSAPHVKAILGYTPEELTGLEDNVLPTILHPSDESKFNQVVEKLMNASDNEIIEGEYRFRHKNGRWVHVFDRVMVFKRNSDGQVLQILGSAIDITERVEFEKKLKESEEKYRTFVQNIQGIAYQGYLDFSATLFEGAVEEITGYRTEDFLTEKIKWDQIIHPDDASRVQKKVESFHSTKTEFDSREYRIVRKDGENRWILEKVQKIYDNVRKMEGVYGITIDITESKKAEQKLKESEEKWKALSENSPAHIMLIDGEHNVISINRTVPDLSKEDVIGTSVYLFVPKEFHQITRDSFNSVWETGEPVTYSTNYITKEGDTRFFDVWIGPVIQSGKIFALVSHSMDVTEKKQAELKLKESEEKYSTLAKLSPVGIFKTDKKGDCVYVNERWSQIAGLTLNEALGARWVERLHPNDRKRVIAEWYNAAENQVPFESEYRFKRLDGKITWVYGQAIAINDNLGKVTGYVGTITDISERKLTEQKLKESEEKYRNFVQNIQGIAYQGYQDFSVVFFDGAVEDITGYTPEDFRTGRIKWDHIIYPDDRPIVQKKVETFHSTSAETDSREYRIVRKDGELRWILEKNQKIHDNIKIIEGVQGILVDITQRKKVEEELKELSKLKSEFLRRASHELKTPLISIKGFSDLILSLYIDQLDPAIISKLREINDGCERLQNIINNLLKTSRLESPELKPKLQKEDLSFLIKFCVHELESLAERRNQVIELDIQSDLYANIEKEEIHDVLSNLLTNAIKYTPPMGKIEIQAELNDRFVVISVKDNGIGFTNEQKKIIFHQFGKIERYGQGLDLGIDGTGLGLYISKRIVESHDGKIWMESEGKGKGSTFYFTLPIDKK